MAIDYAKLAATAKRLVTNAGTSVEFARLNSTPANPSMEWRGATDAETGETTVAGVAVRVEPSSAQRLGLSVEKDGFVKRSQAILIAVPDSDITDFDRATFDGVSYNIEGMQVLRPTDTTLLYFVGIRR